jgi:hypothetical protein
MDKSDFAKRLFGNSFFKIPGYAVMPIPIAARIQLGVPNVVTIG